MQQTVIAFPEHSQVYLIKQSTSFENFPTDPFWGSVFYSHITKGHFTFVSVRIGVLIPFLGTSLGAGTVFFVKNELGDRTKKSLNGFAGGVLTFSLGFSLMMVLNVALG